MGLDPASERPLVRIRASQGATRSALEALLAREGYAVAEENAAAAAGQPSTPIVEVTEATGSSARRATGTASVLADRAAFEEALAREVESASRSGSALAVLSIAVRHEPFRSPNSGPLEDLEETFAAEILTALIAAARRFLAGSDPNKARGRIFAAPSVRTRFDLALTPIARIADAVAFAHALRELFSAPLSIAGHDVRIAAHIGVATYPAAAADAPTLLERAEIASYCVAHQGDEVPQLYTEAMSRWTSQRRNLEQSLRDALSRNELVVHYQPRVHTHTRKIVGLEALVRWQHPSLGMIPPAQFIPIAEENGLIVPIGEWVLREACRQAKAWRDAGLPSIRVGVNVSAVQFRDPKIYDTICGVLGETGLPAGQLELELTESILMRDPKSAITTLQRLANAGIHLSIDDFGTGYSSLSYLKRFPVDALKIDQSFIRQVTNNPEDAAITTTIIVLGHSLGLNVIAEGVETESQFAFLSVLDCNEVQGFLFGRPAPAEQTEAVLGMETAAIAT